MVLHPRHRADCADFFQTPNRYERVDLHIPVDVIEELERTAARAGRTWNDQLCYIVGIWLGHHPPDFDDARSVEDWRTLLSACQYRLTDAEDWIPFVRLGESRQGSEGEGGAG